MVDLDPAAAVAAGLGPDGVTRRLEQVPGRVPADSTSSVFAGYYFAGDPFGWMTIRFTPRA